jgi:hypothetical protein
MPNSARLVAALEIFAIALTGCSARDVTSPSTLFRNNPCLPSGTVQLAAAETVRLDCSNGGTTVTFAGAGASYLIVPEFATDQAPFQLVAYSVASGTLSPATVSASRVRAMVQRPAAQALGAGALPPRRLQTAQFAMDRRLRARAMQLAMSGTFRAFASRAPRVLRGAVPRATPPPGSIRTFHVLSSTNGTTSANAAARLAYVGGNILLYVDTLSPAGGFDSTQVQGFGQYFDQILYPMDTTAFGVPSDIDGNGRVIVLMSPVVNRLTPSPSCISQGFIAGFFNPGDFDGPTDPTSNRGEIFYSIVPDPAGTYSCAHSVVELKNVVPGTFLHELQHLIGFGQHVVVSGGVPGASWLDEGLSIAAEELGSLHYEQQCPPPACRTNPNQLFPDSSQGFIQNFLFDSYEYALLPDTASIALESDADLGSSWRGGAWLLVRWLGDQMGGNGFFKKLEQGPSGGVADIEQATGQTFPSLFANFGLALYTDSLPELPRATAPAANRFVTRNVKQLWARLFATSGPSSVVPRADPVLLFAITADTSTAVLYPGTVTYFRLDTPASAATVSIRFAGPGGAGFASALQPQLAVFRLPAGQ